MKAIQMVNLKDQYLRLKDEMNTAIQDVLQEAAFIGGPQVSNYVLHLGKWAYWTIYCTMQNTST